MSKETAKISVEEIKDRIISQLSDVVVQEWVASGVYDSLVERVSEALACELNVPVTIVNELMKEHLAKRLAEDEDVELHGHVIESAIV